MNKLIKLNKNFSVAFLLENNVSLLTIYNSQSLGWGIPCLKGTASLASKSNKLFNHFSIGSLGAYLMGSYKLNSLSTL